MESNSSKRKTQKWKNKTEKSKEEENNEFIKFPRTRHLFNVGGIGRDDLVKKYQTIYDPFWKFNYWRKINGTNLGISLSADGQLTFQ